MRLPITMVMVHSKQCIRRVLLLEFTYYLTGLGKSSSFEFGKHQLVIYDNIEDAVAPWDQLCFHTHGLA